MIIRCGENRLLLAVLLLTLSSSAQSQTGLPTPTVSPSPSPAVNCSDSSSPGQVASRVGDWNYYRVLANLYYDSDKVVGMFPEYPGAGPNSFIEYQFPNEQVIRVDGELSFGNATQLPIGTPIAFHCYSDWFGHLRGFERVRANPSPVYFVIPVSASALGVGPLVQNYTSTPPGGHGLGLGTSEQVLVGDSNTAPTAALVASSLPGMENLVPSVHVEYLDGNSSNEMVGQETFQFPRGLFSSVPSWVLVWGFELDPLPYAIYTPSHLPLGPARAWFRLSGYQDDVATVELSDLKSRRWTPLLGATFDKPGYPTPSEAAGIATLTAEEGDFILEPAIREKLLGQCELFTNLKHASDRNGDKVLDIADYQKLSLERGGSR